MTWIYLISTYGYVVVLVGTIFEGETILILGGLAAHQGYLNLGVVIITAFIGGTLGDTLFFLLGRYKGEKLLAKWVWLRKFAVAPQKLVAQNKRRVAFGLRFVYGFRHIVPMSLGLTDISTSTFIIYNGLGAAVWSLVFGLGGYFFGNVLGLFFGRIRHYEFRIIFLAIIIAVALHTLYRFVQYLLRRVV